SPRAIEKLTSSSAGTRRLRRRKPERSASRRRNSLRKLWTSTAIMLLQEIGGTRTGRTACRGGARGNRCQPTRNMLRATIPRGRLEHKSRRHHLRSRRPLFARPGLTAMPAKPAWPPSDIANDVAARSDLTFRPASALLCGQVVAAEGGRRGNEASGLSRVLGLFLLVREKEEPG